MEMWLKGFEVALSGTNLLCLLIGTSFGLVIGALPGLGGMFAVALALPMTFNLPVDSAIILLAAVHASCAYGDSLASILINTPGGVGSVASCWDGFPLAQQGKAGLALGVSALGSLAGGLMGWLSLVAISPILMVLALKMGPTEYFVTAMLALSLLSMASMGETYKGLILGGLGLMLAFIGQDPITATSRFVIGNFYVDSTLEGGIPLVPVALGLFALSQAIVLAEEGGQIAQVRELAGGGVRQGIIEALHRPLTILRGGLVGIWLGVMPALGLSSANVVAYLVEKRASSEPQTFGKGNISGLLAPETAKNACVVGDLIPTFTLGVPGSSVTALFMAALIMHGVQPGPRFFQSGVLPYTVFSGILLAQFTFFIIGMMTLRFFAKVVRVPNKLLVPTIVILCFLGSYAMRVSMFDVFICLLFGVVGYILTKKDWPKACLILGLVLGELMESNFHRMLKMSDGSYLPLVTRPISVCILILIVVLLSWPYISYGIEKVKRWRIN